MKLRHLSLILGLVLALPTSGFCRPPAKAHPQNQQYEIFNVHIGMTAAQVEAALVKKFGPHATQYIKIHRSKSVFYKGRTWVFTLDYWPPSFDFSVTFVEVPESMHKGNEAAVAIGYTPRLTTNADILAFSRRVLAKYGPPVEPPNAKLSRYTNYRWCARVPSRGLWGQCNSLTTTPILSLSNGQMSLVSYTLRQKMMSALEAHRTSAGPPL